MQKENAATKLPMLLLISLCVIFSLAGCGNNSSGSEGSPSEEPKINLSEMTAEDVVAAFQDSGFPIASYVVYTEETDVNSLLGRPNQYISKVNFADARAEQYDEYNDPIGGSVETFNNASDAKARYDYIAALVSSSSMFAQYLYLHENVFLRIDNELTPAQAAEYESGFNNLIAGEAPAYTGTKQDDNESSLLDIKDKYSAEIISAELSRDGDGNDAVTVAIQFTNNTDDAKYFNSVFYTQVFQGGIEQTTDGMTMGEGYDWDSYYTEIKDGASITVYQQFPITDPHEEFEVQIESFEGNGKATKLFSL